MEALGPGKTFKKTEREERRARALCGARVRKCVASLGAAAAARPRAVTGKQTEAQPVCVCVCMCVCERV